MATKTSIISDINNKIISKGNILATDTNRILKDILNCDELNTSSSLEAFQFQGNFSQSGTAVILYSIRGIKDLFANITLEIQIKESNTHVFVFPHGEKDLPTTLSNIINDKNSAIDFMVAIKGKSTPAVYKKLGIDPPKSFRIGSLNFGFDIRNLKIAVESQEPDDKLSAGDFIATSFTIHSIK